MVATETRLTAQIATTDNRLTTLDNRFTAQIADSETRLTEQIAEFRMLFVDHLEEHANAR